jgi:hypothetical protein
MENTNANIRILDVVRLVHGTLREKSTLGLSGTLSLMTF